MVERLGRVIYWGFCTIAAIIGVCGTIGALNESYNPIGLFLIAWSIAFVFWVTGRAVLYVLAPNADWRIPLPKHGRSQEIPINEFELRKRGAWKWGYVIATMLWVYTIIESKRFGLDARDISFMAGSFLGTFALVMLVTWAIVGRMKPDTGMQSTRSSDTSQT